MASSPPPPPPPRSQQPKHHMGTRAHPSPSPPPVQTTTGLKKRGRPVGISKKNQRRKQLKKASSTVTATVAAALEHKHEHEQTNGGGSVSLGEKDNHEKNHQEKDSQEKDSQEKDSQEKDNQEKANQEKDNQEKAKQEKENQKKDNQEKDNQEKDDQEKDTQEKDDQEKDKQKKDSQEKDNQKKDNQENDNQEKENQGTAHSKPLRPRKLMINDVEIVSGKIVDAVKSMIEPAYADPRDGSTATFYDPDLSGGVQQSRDQVGESASVNDAQRALSANLHKLKQILIDIFVDFVIDLRCKCFTSTDQCIRTTTNPTREVDPKTTKEQLYLSVDERLRALRKGSTEANKTQATPQTVEYAGAGARLESSRPGKVEKIASTPTLTVDERDNFDGKINIYIV